MVNNHLYEIKSPLILQPGPAALTDGLDALCEIIDQVRGPGHSLAPEQLRALRTDAELQPADIRSVAVVAIGKEFDVEICVRRFGFFL